MAVVQEDIARAITGRCPEPEHSRPMLGFKAPSLFKREEIFLQSFFMLMTIQPFFIASSYSSCVNAPTLVSGRPWAGP